MGVEITRQDPRFTEPITVLECLNIVHFWRGRSRALTLRNVDGPSLELVLGSGRWPCAQGRAGWNKHHQGWVRWPRPTPWLSASEPAFLRGHEHSAQYPQMIPSALLLWATVAEEQLGERGRANSVCEVLSSLVKTGPWAEAGLIILYSAQGSVMSWASPCWSPKDHEMEYRRDIHLRGYVPPSLAQVLL